MTDARQVGRRAVDRGRAPARRRARHAPSRSIQRQGDDRILVQVPGLQDPEQLKDLIGKTAQLTFQMVDIDAAVPEAQAGQRAARRRARCPGRGRAAGAGTSCARSVELVAART